MGTDKYKTMPVESRNLYLEEKLNAWMQKNCIPAEHRPRPLYSEAELGRMLIQKRSESIQQFHDRMLVVPSGGGTGRGSQALIHGRRPSVSRDPAADHVAAPAGHRRKHRFAQGYDAGLGRSGW